MSHEMINRNPDLKRLRDEGFDVEIRAGHLLIKDVPTLNKNLKIEQAILVSELTLAGDTTVTPSTHIAKLIGSYPCNADGSEIEAIRHQSGNEKLADGIVVNHSFSSKPPGGYKNYYEKMTSYINIISGPAQAVDATVSAKTFPVYPAVAGESVFNYLDTATSRAGLGAVTKKLEVGKIAIVGVGGTGAYVLDLIAKTPVAEINLFDGDVFSNHNAFRAPGAPSIDELRLKPKKVAYLKQRYSAMHRNIVAHECYIDANNIEELKSMSFVFLCLDGGERKRPIIEKLEEWGTAFIDVGMGIHLVNESLLGILTVTASTPAKRDHVRNRIPFSGDAIGDEYNKNIQIADLNALNAALAVIKWKKILGFYHDQVNEYFSAYTIDGNMLTNDDAQKT